MNSLNSELNDHTDVWTHRTDRTPTALESQGHGEEDRVALPPSLSLPPFLPHLITGLLVGPNSMEDLHVHQSAASGELWQWDWWLSSGWNRDIRAYKLVYDAYNTNTNPFNSTRPRCHSVKSHSLHSFIRSTKETVQYIQYVYVYKMLLDMDYL